MARPVRAATPARGRPTPTACWSSCDAAAGEPPLAPLRLAEPDRVGAPRPRRRGRVRRPPGRAAAASTPALADLLGQLERDRHRLRAEIARLERRVAELERGAGRYVRVAFVVQRYGEEVAGGAEALCRATAHALAARGDEVEVYTTTARDYLTWAPHYAPGTALDGAVVVHRFAADPPDPARIAALARDLALGRRRRRRRARVGPRAGPRRPADAGRRSAVGAAPPRGARPLDLPLRHHPARDAPGSRAHRAGAARPRRADAALRPHPRPGADGRGPRVHDPRGAPPGGRPPRHRRPPRGGRRGRDRSPHRQATPRGRARALDLPARFALYLGRVDPGEGARRAGAGPRQLPRGGRSARPRARRPAHGGDGAARLGRHHRVR